MFSTLRATMATVALGTAFLLGGCASDTMLGGTATSSVTDVKPRPTPQCMTLASQIESLRKEGVTERVEEAAKGKGDTVRVKRASLAKIAELNALNTEFQSKCATVPVEARPAAPAAPAQKAAATAEGATAKVASKTE